MFRYWVARSSLPQLPELMYAAGRREKSLERAIIDAVETLVLGPRVGELFDATVISVDDKHRATVQLADPAVVGPLDAPHIVAGTTLRVRLAEADAARRLIRFVPAG